MIGQFQKNCLSVRLGTNTSLTDISLFDPFRVFATGQGPPVVSDWRGTKPVPRLKIRRAGHTQPGCLKAARLGGDGLPDQMVYEGENP